MTMAHFYNQTDQPVAIDDLDTRGELSRAVIDNGLIDQSTIEISEDAARCQDCASTDCEHVERVEEILAEHGLARPGAPSG